MKHQNPHYLHVALQDGRAIQWLDSIDSVYDPALQSAAQGYGGKSYTLQNNQDKTHFIFSLSGENEFAKGWFLSGETLLQKGAHDKDISASVQFKRVW